MKKVAFLTVLAWLLVAGSSSSFAQVFAVTKQADIDLLTATAPATFVGTYYNTIGTNASVSYAAGYSGPASGIAGRLLITGALGATVQISCTTSATMRNNTGCCGNRSRTADQFKYVIGTANAVGPGLGTSCAGLGTTPTNHNLTGVAAQDTVLVGMRMNVTNVRIGGQYVTTVGGSTPLTVRVRKTTGGTVTIDTTVNLFAIFESSITLSSLVNMDFGDIAYSGSVAASTARLGTNGAETYTGVFSGAATGTAGSVKVDNVETGVTLEVYCDTEGTLTNGAGASIKVNTLEVDPEDSRGAYGTGSACNGISGAPAMTFSYTTTTRDQIYVGGKLDGATAVSFTGGSYSTANAGGDNIQIDVVNQ